jgi:glycerol-3-phosphate acyltransferase PlsY
MSTAGPLVALVAAAYLAGSVPVANIVARSRAASDLRTVGDRNPGFWNAKAQLGARAAVPVLVGDVVKAALPVLAARALGLPWWAWYVVALAGMVGHAWPVFAQFRGGRSVLAWVGGTLVVAPVPTALAITLLGAAWMGRLGFVRAVRIAVVALPFLQLVVEDQWRTAASGVLMTFVGMRFATAARADRRRAQA